MTKRKRHIASWVLLAVFVPMLLLSSLHVHSHAGIVCVECVDCATNSPHVGHITSGSWHIDTCVLCQFLAVPFLGISQIAILLSLHVTSLRGKLSIRFTSQEYSGNLSTRAPPFRC